MTKVYYELTQVSYMMCKKHFNVLDSGFIEKTKDNLKSLVEKSLGFDEDDNQTIDFINGLRNEIKQENYYYLDESCMTRLKLYTRDELKSRFDKEYQEKLEVLKMFDI